MSSSSRQVRVYFAAAREQQHLAVAGVFFFKHGLFPVEVRPRAASGGWPHYRQKPEQRQGARQIARS